MCESIRGLNNSKYKEKKSQFFVRRKKGGWVWIRPAAVCLIQTERIDKKLYTISCPRPQSLVFWFTPNLQYTAMSILQVTRQIKPSTAYIYIHKHRVQRSPRSNWQVWQVAPTEYHRNSNYIYIYIML